MSILYIDSSAGVSGDMLLRAMLDLGLPASTVAQTLRVIARERSNRSDLPSPQMAGDLIRRIRQSRLKLDVKRKALRVWTLLAKAEGESHGCPWRRVHFHQLGRPETMRNILGFCAGLVYFRVDRVYTGPVPMGNLWRDPSGWLRRKPGPTASHLLALSRLPVRMTGDSFEWTTPTGAALLAAFAAPDPPLLRILRIGHGAGRLRPPGDLRALHILLARECF